jgi:hypothetical protein
MQVEDLNSSITMLECSLVKPQGVLKMNRTCYGKRKSASQVVTSKVAKVLNLPSASLSQVLDNGSKQTCKGCDYLSALLDEVKQKYVKSSKQ